MKKLAIGCLVILVLGGVVLTVGAYFLYRAATPMVEEARNYVRGWTELSELEKNISNTAPHQPPASGELTAAQMDRFARVQEHVGSSLGERMRQFEEQYRHLKSSGDGAAQPAPSFTELLNGLRELADVFVQARRYQVDALNKEGFSQTEYSWVRARVFQAAGVEAVSSIDFSKLEQVIRDNTGAQDVNIPRLPENQIPARNRDLVKPYLERMDRWIPLAMFGL